MRLLSQTARNLRYSTLDGVFATPWTLLSLPGSFLMAGLLNSLFSIGPFWFGIIAAMPALANGLQMALVPFLARFMQVRDLTLSQSWLNAGLWFSGFVGVAFLPADQPNTAGLFFALLFFLTSVSLSLAVLGWMAWAGDFIPSRIRGRFFGRRNRIVSLTTLAFMLLSVLVLDLGDASRGAYLGLAGVALVGRLVSIMVQHRIVSRDPTGGPVASANWAADLAGLRRHRTLVRFIVFGTIFGFWTAAVSTLAPLYALGELGASPAKYTSFNIVATLSGAAFLRIWGELIDRHGAVPVIVICLVAWRTGDFGWVLITPDSLNWMYLLWLWGGAMGTGFLLASFTLLLKLIPKDRRAAGISLNLTATSGAAVAAPILVGLILDHAGSQGWDLVASYRWMLGLSLGGSILCAALLLGFKEPETTPERNTIHGAMRTLRFLTVNQGLAFLSNATFVVRRRR